MQEMDPLSDILTMFTVNRAIPIRFESSGPYAMRFGPYEHVKFGAVLFGALNLQVDGQHQPIRLEAGDCYFRRMVGPIVRSIVPRHPNSTALRTSRKTGVSGALSD